MNIKLIEDLVKKVEVNPVIKNKKKIGGLTNQNFLVQTNHAQYVVRIAGENTSSYINRYQEKENSLIMEKEKIYFGDLYFDESSGNKITYYQEGCFNFAEIDLLNRFEKLSLVAKTFNKVHTTKAKFANTFDFFNELDKYLTLCNENNVQLFDGFNEIYTFVLGTKEAYYNSQDIVVPCHIDPLGENFIFTATNLYLIDWEYSAMHDKCWDLAGFILENELNAKEEGILVQEYVEITNGEKIRDKILLYKIYQDFLWHLWGLYKFSLNEDFYDYAKKRFQRSLINLKMYEGCYD